MITALLIIGGLGLIVQALIGLSFFISCIWEKEPRATVFSGLQFLVMSGVLLAYLYLIWIGFLKTSPGTVLLIAGYIFIVLAAFLLLKKTTPSPKALKETKGFITGDVKRQDERSIVFARNRSLRLGSKQYMAFYKHYPQYREGSNGSKWATSVEIKRRDPL